MSNEQISGLRSPSYPVMSLSDAVTAVGKIEAQYRSAKVDRELAAKIIGYSGLSGPANKALAALAQYGLVERAGKGEMRVTSRARAILHPDTEDEKRQELRAAALEPQLFRELQERYPNMRPPEDGVVIYLNRKGFNQSAIRPAAKAYLQTLLYLEEVAATESHGNEPDAASESASDQMKEPVVNTEVAAQQGAPIAASPDKLMEERSLNDISMNIRGGKVLLEGLLNYDGVLELEEKLKALKLLLPRSGGEKPN